MLSQIHVFIRKIFVDQHYPPTLDYSIIHPKGSYYILVYVFLSFNFGVC